MRGVFERVKGSGDWFIRYSNPAAPGKKIREHVGRFNVAVEALVKRRQEIREARWIGPQRQVQATFHAVAEKMIENKEGRCSDRTIYGNRRWLERINSHIGDQAVNAITPETINKLLKWLRTAPPLRSVPPVPKRISDAPLRAKKHRAAAVRKDIGGGALNNYRCFLGSVFNYGIANGFCTQNPVKATLEFKRDDDRVRFLMEDEEAAIRPVMREWNPDLEAEMDLTLNTGLRSGESFHLTWDKVDLQRKILTVPFEGKTGRRFIPLNSVACEALRKLHKQSAGSAYVYFRHKSDHDKRSQRFQRIVKRAGVINFRWHDLRHTFASRLVMAGVALRQVQDFLGHASIVQTMRYAHLSPGHGQAAIERICPAAPPKKVRRIA